MLKYILLLLVSTSCAIGPKYSAQERGFCRRESYTYICPGYDESNREHPIDYIRKHAREVEYGF